MKIGILTQPLKNNYGGILQAYALQTYIEKNYDCDAELIDYMPKNEFVGKKLLVTRLKRLGTYIKNFGKYYVLRKNRGNQEIKKREFDKFFELHMVTSSWKVNSAESLAEHSGEYDAVMVGSDQTWNPFVSKDGIFLLDWLKDRGVSKIAYAPSIGVSRIPDEWHERYKAALSGFDALSCRERGGAGFLSELLGKDVEFVIDPTLLLTPDDWEEISTPEEVDGPYLLTYFLGDNKAHRKAVEKIAKEKNLKIVALPVSYLETKNKGIDKRYVGPGGFITLIKNASFVCTDSFHGTMFSINFGKDFVSFTKRNDADINSDNNRLYDALGVFGLQDRLCIKGEFSDSAVDYALVNERLGKLRASSRRYLDRALSTADKE